MPRTLITSVAALILAVSLGAHQRPQPSAAASPQPAPRGGSNWQVPRTPWGDPDLSDYDRCITRGVVGSMVPVGYNAGNEIVQAPGYVALRNEMIHETRIIPLDGRPHLSPVIRQYMGDPRGRWDGDTLVVETANLTAMTGVGANGRALFHSGQLRLTERFTLTSEEAIQYEAMVDDAVMWTRPFVLTFPLWRDPDYGMFEYACHEGNYGLRNILSGSRADERR